MWSVQKQATKQNILFHPGHLNEWSQCDVFPHTVNLNQQNNVEKYAPSTVAIMDCVAKFDL
jgi:hypothetical protein